MLGVFYRRALGGPTTRVQTALVLNRSQIDVRFQRVSAFRVDGVK